MTNIPKSSLDASFPDNSDFQLTDTLKSQENLTKKVISGTAVEGKSNIFTEAKNSLLYPNGESVGDTIMSTVVEPAIKNLASNVVGSFFDIVADSINKLIFRGDTPDPTYGSRYNRGGNSYVTYGSMFNNPSGYYNVTPGYTGYSSISSGNNTGNTNMSPNIPNRYSNIILSNRGEAETFIDDLLFTVNQYQSISVANVYAKLDWPSTFQDTKWGWTPDILNPNTIVKRRVANGAWRVQLPRPISIDI